MANVKIVTKEGQRLDQIAVIAYGNPFAWQEIIDANPSLPLLETYPAGIEVALPILPVQPTDSVPKELLPPWKRSNV